LFIEKIRPDFFMNSALIIRGGAIGDFVLTLPSAHGFREAFPKVRLEMMGYMHIAELARQRFYVEAIRSMDHRSVAGFFATRGELDPDLSNYFASFDLIVTYLYDPDTVFFDNLKRSGAKKVVVADSRPTGLMHASDYLAQWLSEFGIPFKKGTPILYPSEKDRQEADRILPANSKSIVALHPGSGSPSKNWPVRRFLELASWLKLQGIGVLVLDGPADSEVSAAFWKDPSSRSCIRCHGMALPTVAAVLQKCTAFVGHDSGISHVCAAVGTPTIVIFGPTNPKVWAPRGKSVIVLSKGSGTSSVTLEDVKKELEILLKG
jgi:heptosyltransferase-2